MNTKFTEKAENALTRAVRIAEDYGHTYVGSEHILIAIAKDEGCCGASILKKRKVTSDKLDSTIKKTTGSGHKTKLSSNDTTPRCRHILQTSYKAAKKYLSEKIGTEHILYAILDESESVAEKLLLSIGIDISGLRDDVVIFLKTASLISELAPGEINIPIPNLLKYGTNMTKCAELDEYDPVIGRDKETERLIRILTRKNKNNPCLIGDAGVGKTAIVEGLAKRIANGAVPDSLLGKIIISLDLTSMVAGAKYRGDFEDRIKNILSEAAKNKSVILFIDEIHTLVGAGSAEGAIDAANIMKPQLSRGEIRVIGATTINEYRKYIEKDSALERRFQPLLVEEPSEIETIEILRGLKERYESYHGVKISDDALERSVKLSKRHMHDRYFPDKALDLLDEACAMVASSSIKFDNQYNNSGQTCNFDKEKFDFLNTSTPDCMPEYTADCCSSKALLGASIRGLQTACKDISLSTDIINTSIVNAAAVEKIIDELYGKRAALSIVSNKEFYDALSSKILGQEKAVREVVSAITRNKIGICDESRPQGIFLFAGGSGVGKTEMAKVLSELLFNDDESLIKVDMSEFSEPSSVAKLIGSAPGYVGYDESNSILEKVRRHPYSVVLLDEIDKANKDVISLFLQIFDNGFVTDSTGRKINFRNSYIVMTSNITTCSETGEIGFLGNDRTKDDLKKLNGIFSREFLNRIDSVIPFSPLGICALDEITFNKLKQREQRYREIGYKIEYHQNVSKVIAQIALKEGGGARPIGRLITGLIDARIAELITNGAAVEGSAISVSFDEELKEPTIEIVNSADLIAVG